MIEEGVWNRRTRKPRKGVADDRPQIENYRFRVRTPLPQGTPFTVSNLSNREIRITYGAMIRWCREQFGESNDRWNHRTAPSNKGNGRVIAFVFLDHQDAFAFQMRWC